MEPPFYHAYHIILKTEIFIFIPFVFIVIMNIIMTHLFMLTEILLFPFLKLYLWFPSSFVIRYLFIYLFDVNLPMILHPPFTSSEASKANFPSFTNFLIITVLSSFYFYPYKLVFSCPTNNKISWFHCNKQTRIFPFLPGSYHILLHFFRIICESQ